MIPRIINSLESLARSARKKEDVLVTDEELPKLGEQLKLPFIFPDKSGTVTASGI